MAGATIRSMMARSPLLEIPQRPGAAAQSACLRGELVVHVRSEFPEGVRAVRGGNRNRRLARAGCLQVHARAGYGLSPKVAYVATQSGWSGFLGGGCRQKERGGSPETGAAGKPYALHAVPRS